ncbi:Aim36p ASCRUDRAFT_5891 [Ascoidea rubescens DSM 1968]|uniref:Altered inheritance of mitochondria protein 36, mitochondrial n=1 Tax=Ascoidea rubescens DSM 1968 TaxID=1344418 RepID=A0A1D2VR02_9ASCO|nr:hypothetical protein ASCRUDRAFT_5891 [Ascoidea rubescens DSM 1968]ODV63995.1 hypothetical protein ASCRUDRAFT_5891 [Ascoidea rubescens DSM 1968]
MLRYSKPFSSNLLKNARFVSSPLKTVKPFYAQNLRFNQKKYYSNNAANTSKSPTGIVLSILFISVASCFAVYYTAKSLENPSKSKITESDLQDHINGLKRKKTMFQAFEVNIDLLPGENLKKDDVKKIVGDSVFVIDPPELINRERAQGLDAFYGPFLIELQERNAPIPAAVTVNIIGKEIKKIKKEQENDESDKILKFLVINFPQDLEQSIKFERDVKTADSIIKVEDIKNDVGNKVFQYFETVDKIKTVQKIKNLGNIYKKD